MSKSTDKGALDGQVGGTHYKTLGIQPVQFTMANRWDPCAHSILKYVQRHRAKNGREDIEKAFHFVELRAQQMMIHGRWKVEPAIAMKDYIERNVIIGYEAEALRQLYLWVVFDSDRACLALKVALSHILDQYNTEARERRASAEPEQSKGIVMPGADKPAPPAAPPMIDGRGREVQVTSVQAKPQEPGWRSGSIPATILDPYHASRFHTTR